LNTWMIFNGRAEAGGMGAGLVLEKIPDGAVENGCVTHGT